MLEVLHYLQIRITPHHLVVAGESELVSPEVRNSDKTVYVLHCSTGTAVLLTVGKSRTFKKRKRHIRINH